MNKKITCLMLTIVLIFSNIAAVAADNITTQVAKLSDLTVNGTPHWSKDFVEKLVEKGIITGYPDGTFKPNNSVEVDAFIKMVVCSLGYNFENGKDYWAMPYIEKAKELKLIDGTEFNTYRRIITREEAAKIIVNALATKEQLPSEEQINKFATKVPDYLKISDKYKKVALYAYATGLITGNERGYFNPQNNLSRAEAATVIMRLIDPSLRQPIKLDGEITTLPELLKSDEEVWGLKDIENHTSLARYDVKDGKLYFKEYQKFENLLPKETLNPNINKQVHDLAKVLIDDKSFTMAFYRPTIDELGSQVSVYLSKDYGYGYNGFAFFDFGFADDKPYRVYDDFRVKGLSNNATIQLGVHRLWWEKLEDGSMYKPREMGWVVPYYAEKLKKSCMAVFGVDTGAKIYDHVMKMYLFERTENLDKRERVIVSKTIDNIQIDYVGYDKFYFTYK